MELVRGVPITEFCDQNHFSVRQRLELFTVVCQAVQHAHQKGIIHRDIKPSNVMVTLHDDKPVVKVIDFGIAKAMGQRLTDKTLFTNFAQMIGTPMYMSPEQAQLSGLDIDTRSDIYSLGVLLYELLTGTTPFHQERLRQAAYDEMRRIIREEEPARPSTRISTLGQAASTVSANRQSDPKRLSQVCRGELDWIVMKALEKDRNRRYETATGLARDVERYLKDEPVQACPPTAAYRFRKFARRHKGPLTTAGLLLTVLVAGTVVSAWQAVEATKAEKTATAAQRAETEAKRHVQEIAEKATKDLEELNTANALIESGRLHVAFAEWAQAEDDLSLAVKCRPDHSRVWLERAELYLRLGLWNLAAADHASAYEIHPPSSTSSWYFHALLRMYAGDTDGYQRCCQQMHARFADSTDPLACDETARACLLVAEPAVERAKLVRLAERGVEGAEVPWRLTNLGTAYYRVGDYQKALKSLHRSQEVNANWQVAWNRSVLAMAHHKLGDADLARRHLDTANDALGRQIWAMFQGGPGSLPTAWWDIVHSIVHYREAHQLIVGKPAPDDARLRIVRARAMAAVGRESDAEMDFRKAFKLNRFIYVRFSKPPPENHPKGRWEVRRFVGHSSSILAAAFSPDGGRVLTGSTDKTIRLWEVETGKELHLLEGHRSHIRSVAFSPDGRFALSGALDATARLWDLETAKEVRSFEGPRMPIQCVAFSPDGRRVLAGGNDKTLFMWDAETGKELRRFEGHTNAIMTAAFSADGLRVLSGSADKTVRIWNAETGKELSHFTELTNSVHSVVFTADGAKILSGSYVLQLTDIGTSREPRRFVGHIESVLGGAVARDGRHVLSGGSDATVRLWDVNKKSEVRRLVGHVGNVHCVAFSPDGRYAFSGGGDCWGRLWDIAKETQQPNKRD
jgi:tetratricopeptide (TPR) repeat protein